ncbi:O-antigen ligase family protein [Trichocoleus sp. FACHB-591]|uniref:O-antigen ligase family protein n=1 Tax=Trichocoleus sp. FACHB-591 TaxID=2692872 RepID=UPI00168223B3|nr:O-antigen ligase family protein [Trichocoleus sp. FACHB-591]MBD2096300.1 O-antigen ligase family protein [Trichocoleus sp. FACHB-591]
MTGDRPLTKKAPSATPNSKGSLLGLLVACFYVLFTLLPDSNTLVVSWPWVFLWQVGLACLPLWLLWMVWHRQECLGLGNGLDAIAGLTVVGLVASATVAEFPVQARWYAWAALCFLAGLYALNYKVQTPRDRYHLLVGQGYLNLTFIIVSLGLWLTQTILPELNRLQTLRQSGADLSLNLSTLELRNWAPIGHPNYVAGYLLLELPLLVALSILQTGRQRWLWLVGVGLGLVMLYTTGSRGGWLGLTALCVVGFVLLLFRSSLPRLWLGLGSLLMLTFLSLSALTNERLKTAMIAILSGQLSGDFAYRMITAVTGWRMGIAHPVLGSGPGSVPIVYQQYRPGWAGREAELTYQLHSTPVQIWAELGLWGMGTSLIALVLLAYLSIRWVGKISSHSTVSQHTDQVFVWSILASLFGYGISSLTDYQLDNVCISGTLILFIAILAAVFCETFAEKPVINLPRFRVTRRMPQGASYMGLGLLLVISIWLIPIHRAWQLSSQGFIALSRENIPGFVQRLSQAAALAPWESYYSYQLGWNLGNLSLQTNDLQQQSQLQRDGIAWFQKGIQASPYQEFGHTNLAWLLLNQDPQAATQEFVRSAQLVPAKRGVFYGLGLSLLAQGKVDLATEAVALEALRDPLLITSPLWRSPTLQPLYVPMLDRVTAKCTELLQTPTQLETIRAYCHQLRGGLNWWRGNLRAAHTDWDTHGTLLSQVILQIAEGKTVDAQLQVLPNSPGKLAIAAWLAPDKRQSLLNQAWLNVEQSAPPSTLIQTLSSDMNQLNTFDQWLKQNTATRQYRRTRTGFGILIRHVDGPAPTDFLTVAENAVMTNFFPDVLSVPPYIPAWDLVLQASRYALLQTL